MLILPDKNLKKAYGMESLGRTESAAYAFLIHSNRKFAERAFHIVIL